MRPNPDIDKEADLIQIEQSTLRVWGLAIGSKPGKNLHKIIN